MPFRAVAEVNLAAIERNVGRLRERLNEGAQLCAVVKADGYGHGAVPAARAALAGGAVSLAVATAEEAVVLRGAGLDCSVLVMGALSEEELPVAIDAGAELVAWDERFVGMLRRVVGERARQPLRVHVKLDSGMGRLGTRDLDEALDVARAVDRSSELALAGAMTHFATADGDLEFVERQLAVFERFTREVRRLNDRAVIHAANSAAVLRVRSSHLDLVRCGIAIYGCDPMNEDPRGHGLEPALSLVSYVAAVKPARAGDSAGYGRRFIASEDTWVATLPIGYADGVARRLTNNCDVLIGGRRYPLVGTVSMDNITVDVGPAPQVAVGERAVLIGADGGERQTAEDIARRLDTINYEVLCHISRRVPRVYHRDGASA